MPASVYVCTYVRMCVCTYVCMYLCRYLCTYACMHVRMRVCMYVCVYVCMYVCVYVCNNVCMHVCMYVLIRFADCFICIEWWKSKHLRTRVDNSTRNFVSQSIYRLFTGNTSCNKSITSRVFCRFFRRRRRGVKCPTVGTPRYSSAHSRKNAYG